MTCGVCIIALVEIAAARAFILGISALCAGRRYNGRHIVVTEPGDSFGLCGAAAVTGTGKCSYAVLKAGRGFGNSSAVKRVSECVGIVITVAVVALFAGVQGASLFGTAWCDNGFGIIVTCCFDSRIFGLGAYRTFSRLNAVLCTGSRC